MLAFPLLLIGAALRRRAAERYQRPSVSRRYPVGSFVIRSRVRERWRGARAKMRERACLAANHCAAARVLVAGARARRGLRHEGGLQSWRRWRRRSAASRAGSTAAGSSTARCPIAPGFRTPRTTSVRRLPEPAVRRSARPGPPLLFVAPRSAFQILDDWGELTGHGRQRLEQHRVRESRRAGTLGAREHAHGGRGRERGHGGLSAARQPDVRDARPSAFSR